MSAHVVGRRWAVTSILVGLGLAALQGLATPPPASSQGETVRPPCSDGAGNVRDQIRGEIVDAILPDWLDHPWGPESPDDLWDRCMEPFLGTPGGSSASGFGDPHMVTLDGLAYDLQAAGDVVAVETPDGAGGDGAVVGFQVQARLHRAGPISWVDGVAIATPGGTVAVDGQYRDGPVVMTLDDEEVDLGGFGWTSMPGGVVFVDDDVTTVVLDSGAGLRMDGMAFEVAVPPSWAGQVRGVLGDGDGDPGNDLARRGGATIDPADPEAVYGPWLDDWLVAPDESLFPTAFDDAWGPTRPDEVVVLADLPPRDVATAAATCADVGLEPGAGLESCTFDVAVTGDGGLAADQPPPRPGVVPAGLVDPLVDATVDLAVGDAVGPDTPVAGAGRLAGTGEVDEYTLAGGDAQRWLVPTAPCAAPLAAVAMVMDGDRVNQTLPMWCGRAHPLPTGAVTLRIADPSGTAGSYGFRIADRPDVAAPEAVEARVGLPVDLVLTDAGQTAIAEVELVVGQRVFVETIAEAPSLLSLTGPTGVEVTGWAVFLDSGVIEVEDDGVHTLAAEPVGTNTGTVTLLVHDVPDDPVTTAAVGDEVRVELPVPGQVARVELDLDAGETIAVTTSDSVPGTYLLSAPDGTEVNAWPPFLDSGPMTAPAAGTHVITFDPQGAEAGTIAFTIGPG